MYPDFLTLVIFGIVAGFTPGPNNITASYSGFNFGFKKTIPLMLGVIFGWTLLLFLMNAGLIIIFRNYPYIQDLIKVLGSLFLVYMAYLIAFSKDSKSNKLKNPVGFFKTFLFQFINPKGIIVATFVISTFIDIENYVRDSIIVISFFFMIAASSIGTWCLMGRYLRKFATSEKFIRNFNYTMSFLLIVCVILFYV
tara:strand:- start:3493 stop:4080 length:588 start_codon:yes stop_codon:yes gene_type:complete